MENCYVKELKGSSSDISLPILGYLKFKLDRQTNNYPNKPVRIAVPHGSGNISIEIKGDANFCNADGTIIGKTRNVSTSDANIYVALGSGEAFVVVPKTIVSINEFPYGEYDQAIKVFPEISYMDNLESINMENSLAELDVESMNNLPSIEVLSFAICPNIIADVSVFNKFTTLSRLTMQGTTKISGNVESLSNLINLSGTMNWSNLLLSGDLKTLFDSLYSNGKQSGTLKIWTLTNSGLKYNGSSYNKRVWNVTFSSSGHTETNDDA